MEWKDRLPEKKPQLGEWWDVRLLWNYMGALEELRGHVEFEQCCTASTWASSAQARLPSGATEHLVFLRSRPWRPRPTGGPAHWRPRPLEVPPGCRGNPLQPSSGLCGAAGERRCHSNGGACLAWSRERGAHPRGRRCRCPCGERAPRGTDPDREVRPGRGGSSVGSSCVAVGFQVQHWKTFICILQMEKLRPGRERPAPSQRVDVQAELDRAPLSG